MPMIGRADDDRIDIGPREQFAKIYITAHAPVSARFFFFGVCLMDALDRIMNETPRPVVMLSADATRRDLNRLLSLGARAYLTKPIGVRAFCPGGPT